MSRRDNWNRLVTAVVRRQQLWELCHADSRTPSTCSATSDEEIEDFLRIKKVPITEPALKFLLENVQKLLVDHINLISGAESELEQLQNELELMKAFLDESANKRQKGEVFRQLEKQIREVVYKAQDTLDTCLTQAAAEKSSRLKSFNPKRVDLSKKVKNLREQELQPVFDRARMGFATLPIADVSAASSELSEENNLKAPEVREANVVGFEDEAETLKGFLTQESEQLDVISIIGMPGLGKTTLAGKIFRDPVINYEFPTRIWVYVSQEFTKRDIFFAILKEFTKITDDIKRKNDRELADLVGCHLDTVKFLLVLDDIWSPEDWDKLRIALPKNNRRGKVMITSCQVEVGRHVNRNRDPHMLRFLTPEESWELLRWEVFGKLEFPPDLEVEGKLIAERCDGLPIAIVVIGGILVKRFWGSGDLTGMKKAWREVYERFNTYLTDLDSEKRMEKIISLSYERLPYYLRECFLYVGLFPEDFEIPAWKLIRMWIAEGLIQQKDGVSLEETAEIYLDDLINRNLVRAEKLKPDGKVKTCRVHDMLRDFCRSEAGIDKEGFFQEFKKSDNGCFQPPIDNEIKYRRLCIHSNVLDFLSARLYGPNVRSFVCFSRDEIPMPTDSISAVSAGFKLLRVLDVQPIKFSKLPSDMYQLLHLRYITLSFNSKVLPAAFSKLWNIQTLVVDTSFRTLRIDADILNMIQLRHFKTNASASLAKIGKSSKGGERIQTLGTISAESCTKEVFDRARNLRKLGVRGRLALLRDDKSASFDNFEKLDNLEKLKLINDAFPNPPYKSLLRRLPPAYKFPTKLRILTLSETSLDWSNMSVLGSLEKLEVLKLKDRAFNGESWEAMEGGFRQLEVLHIGRTNLKIWLASHYHFPRLKHLELKNCENLQQIPIGLADIPNFVVLDLYRCKYAALSAKKIQEAKMKSAGARPFRLSLIPPGD